MKDLMIRRIIILYILIVAGILYVMLYQLNHMHAGGRDMVFFHAEQQDICKDYEAGMSISELEERYACRIVLITDRNYEAVLNELYARDALVMDLIEAEELIGRIGWLDQERVFLQAEHKVKWIVLCSFTILLLSTCFVLLMMDIRILRPFRELQSFTTEIARGNLELPLPVHKENAFGAFTESFDVMREELLSAREREAEAEKSKRELVAELSHDIKTPISTIKAVCEVLEVKQQRILENKKEQNKEQEIREISENLEKIGFISQKADTIDQLVNNLFHATLEELTVLEVHPVERDSRMIEELFTKLRFYGAILMDNHIPECLVYMDPLRMEQVIDNVVSNSYKYAGTDIHVAFADVEGYIKVSLWDNGPGVPEEDLAFVTEKFFRGTNAEGKQGSGLGLYLAKWFMERQQGGMECYNADGFHVELFVRKV